MQGQFPTRRLACGFAALAIVSLSASSVAEPGLDTGRLGIGGAVGHEWQVDERDGDQISLMAQYRLTPRLSAELEIGQTEYHDSNDVDKRLGGALAYQVGRLGFLSPYIVGGLGSADSADTGSHTYAEAGAGVKFPISRHVVLMLDVRSGRHFAGDDDDSDDVLAPRAATGGGNGTVDLISSDIDYSRWRLVGVVFF